MHATNCFCYCLCNWKIQNVCFVVEQIVVRNAKTYVLCTLFVRVVSLKSTIYMMDVFAFIINKFVHGDLILYFGTFFLSGKAYLKVM